MSYTKSLFSFVFAAALAFPFMFTFTSGEAQADVFVWKNQAEDVSLSFPDRWGVISNLADDEILRIAAPAITGRTEDAQCRMRVREDKRFQMHPVSNSGALQREYFGLSFWDDYKSEFKNASVTFVKNNTGLGRGFASMADITYEPQGNPKMIRRGIAFASLYQNKVHIVECSAEQSAYLKWYPSFMGVIKSVDFKPMVPFKRGYYRDFYAGETIIHGRREVDDYTF